MHKGKKANESRFSEDFLIPVHRSMSCLNIEHHYPHNFVPTLKPKTLFDNPSPMCLGNLHDSSLILEKVNLYEGIRSYSDDESNKSIDLKSKFKKEDNLSKLNHVLKSEEKNVKKFKSNLQLCKLLTDDEKKETKKASPLKNNFKNFKKEMEEDFKIPSIEEDDNLNVQIIEENENEVTLVNKNILIQNEPQISPRKSILNTLESKRKKASINEEENFILMI